MAIRNGDGYSLVELAIVIAFIAAMLVLAAPAFIDIAGAGNVTQAAQEVAGALESARAYAMANHTYVWVGFYEEDGLQASATPAVAGIGRIVISTVASKDGSIIYDPNDVKSPATIIDPARLIQVNELVWISRMHLKTFAVGSGTGDTFDTRPKATKNLAQIGDVSPSPSLTPIQYPLGCSPAMAQYTFKKVIQFSPLGEARVNNTNYDLRPVVEIGMQPLRGKVPDAANPAVVQITGILGNVKIYRR